MKQSSSLNFSNRVHGFTWIPFFLKNTGYVSGQFMQDCNASLYLTKIPSATKVDYKIQQYLHHMWLLILIYKL